jgi:hypothetical protein
LSKKKPPNGMCLVLGDSTPTLVPALDERWWLGEWMRI